MNEEDMQWERVWSWIKLRILFNEEEHDKKVSWGDQNRVR